MSNSSATLANLDAMIELALDSAGLVDTLTIGAREIQGYFNRGYQTVGAGDDEHQVELITFDCPTPEWPDDVETETEVIVAGAGTFRVISTQTNGIGRTVVILGQVLSSG